MRAILCNAFKGIEALGFTEVDEPRPAANEVLVDVHAASVSYMDYLMSCGGQAAEFFSSVVWRQPRLESSARHFRSPLRCERNYK